MEKEKCKYLDPENRPHCTLYKHSSWCDWKCCVKDHQCEGRNCSEEWMNQCNTHNICKIHERWCFEK